MSNAKILGCKASTTVSSVMSGVTGVVVDYIKSKFPKDYFKSQYINMTLISNKMDWGTWNKVQYPALSVEPEMQLNESLGSPWVDYYSSYLYFYKNTKDNYLPVFYNDVDNIFITTIPQRLKFQFNFKIRTRGKMQALDLMNFIVRNFQPGGYFYLNNIKLQTEIPKVFAKIIAMEKGFDIANENSKDVNRFLNYLNQYSQGYLQRTIDLADGNERYEFSYLANILFKLSDKPTGSYSNKAKDEGFTDVEFSFEVELWTPADFLIEIGQPRKEYDKLEGFTDVEFNSFTSNNAYFNITLQQNVPLRTLDNKNMILRQKFISENVDTIDSLDLSDIIEDRVMEIMDFCILRDIPLDNIFTIKLYYGNNEVSPESINFNYDTKTLDIYSPFPQSVYHLFIYADIAKLHEIEMIKEKMKTPVNNLEELIVKY